MTAPLPSLLEPPLTDMQHAVDQKWFEEQVMAALPELLAGARRLTRNGVDAEDLVAEAVAKAWTHRGSLTDRGRFRPWLARIMTNAFISAQRGRRAEEAETLDSSDEEPAFSIFERLHQPFLLWWSNPEKQFLDRVLREDLERAIDALPESFRIALVMVELHGMSYQDIADTLEVPIGTVRSRVARARSLLQRALWDHALDAGLVRHNNRTLTND